MRENRDVFQAIEGTDENGVARAVCCLMVERRFRDMRLTPEVQKIAYIQDASVSVSLTRDFVVVDLRFENYVDYDYL